MWLGEWCRQVEAEEVSNSRNKILQTMYKDFFGLCTLRARIYLESLCFSPVRRADLSVFNITLESIVPWSLNIYGDEVLSRKFTVKEVICDLLKISWCDSGMVSLGLNLTSSTILLSDLWEGCVTRPVDSSSTPLSSRNASTFENKFMRRVVSCIF